MTDTRSENRMQDDPQIRVEDLKNDLALMRFAGFWPAKVECGPLVFEFIVNWAILENPPPTGDYWTEDLRLVREERMRQELLLGLADMTFYDMPVRLYHDVPDGRLWPPRERGGMVVKPFPGTEAYVAI